LISYCLQKCLKQPSIFLIIDHNDRQCNSSNEEINMKIAILGGGHGAYAAAADLSEHGHEVRLWRRDAQALEIARQAGSILLKDSRGEREVAVSCFTSDMFRALHDAELILLPGPATAQLDIARGMAAHCVDGQVVFLPPGTFGSLAMAMALKKAGCHSKVMFAETGTLPYLTRKHGPRHVAITMRAKRLPTGVFPADDSMQALSVIRQAYPAIEPITDALSAALMNAGPIIHPPLILMNAGPLAHFQQGNLWDIHKEGTQEAVRKVHDALDAERIAVREALGYRPYHFPLRDHYTTDQWMYGDAHDKLTDSGDWREKIDLQTHRYMREDVVYGLAFLVSVGQWAKVPMPVSSGLLAIASAVLGEDILSTSPRTLEAMQLSHLTRAQMAQLLASGGLN
jgi:opine dehydrogenase